MARKAKRKVPTPKKAEDASVAEGAAKSEGSGESEMTGKRTDQPKPKSQTSREETEDSHANSSVDGAVAHARDKAETLDPPPPQPEAHGMVENETTNENDNILSLVELAVLINNSHKKAEEKDEEALRCAWDAGNWLELAYKRITEEKGYGGWGIYLAENCPAISRTTVWRYRKVAACFTVEQLTGMTLSDAYAKMDVAKYEEESVATEVQTEPTGRKKQPAIVKLLKNLVTASKHFDEPTTLLKRDRTSVKKAVIKLEEVHNVNAGPSILAVTWREKLDKDVAGWSEDERDLFEADFVKLQAVHEKVQAIREDQ